jgi:hypothetical protein
MQNTPVNSQVKQTSVFVVEKGAGIKTIGTNLD